MTDDTRRRTWDYGLMMLTVILLGALGVQSFIGTLYVWWAQRTIPGWEAVGYAPYVQAMNALAAPLLMLIVLAMGLCVPKRLFSRRSLLAVSVAMLAAGAAAGIATGSLAIGVTAYLSLATLIQVAVVVLTAAGARGPSYLTQGRLTKLGSGLLHLGFIVFAILVASLQRSPFMLPVFWVSTVLMVGGTAMSFYADRLAIRRPAPQEGRIEL